MELDLTGFSQAEVRTFLLNRAAELVTKAVALDVPVETIAAKMQVFFTLKDDIDAARAAREEAEAERVARQRAAAPRVLAPVEAAATNGR